MKELPIAEKAIAYDKLLGKAKQIYNKENDVLIIHTLEDLFPELKESEDEKVRKELIEFTKTRGGFKQEWITWLEKQGEHANFRNKIQIGDKVTRNKDGVLVNLSQLNRIAKKDEKQGEQKPTIEIKTPEESLGIDSEIYNKIVDECIYGDDKQKPAWSEEDEEHYKACLQYFDAVNPDMVYYKDYQWLKSLKERIGG